MSDTATPVLIDQFDRAFSYLRLSVTEACNFRCGYCLPNGFEKVDYSPLDVSEIRRLTTAFAELGFWKVRVTGGEPTLRKDLQEILQAVAQTPGVGRLALSTNGFQLKKLAPALRAAGVSHLNISVDTLDAKRFREVTAHALSEVLAGIDRALELDFSSIKINAVLLKDVNDDISPFLEWMRRQPVSIRMIELMKTGTNPEYFAKHHCGSSAIQKRLLSEGWKRKSRSEGDGPAVEFSHPEYLGSFGIIAPYSTDFCISCNRLRITAQGNLRLCLFSDGGFDLRPYLQADSQKAELQAAVISLLSEKKASHLLNQGNSGDVRHFASIGG